jgi:hypothetical protein
MTIRSQKEVLLHFKGNLSYDVIGELIGSLKDKMRQQKVRFGLYKKILTLMIESLENIFRYRSHFGSNHLVLDDYPPEFLLAFDDDIVIIETVNAIFNSDINALKKRLEQLNKLDLSQLKDLYKATITNGKFSEKGGAGLGIIEMAKIADEKIDFNFELINDQISEFRLRLVIKKTLLRDDV